MAADEHVMTPYKKRKKRNGQRSRRQRSYNQKIRFLENVAINSTHDTHRRQDQNVHFRMPEEPKKVLEEDWIATQRRVKDPHMQENASSMSKTIVMAMTGMARMKMMLVAYMDHKNNGRTKPGQSRSSHFVDGHDEVQAR